MRRLIAVVAITFAACGAVADNIDISIDVESIVANTCEQAAELVAGQVANAVEQVGQQVGDGVAVPDIDVISLIDKASDFGCSPENLKMLVTEQLESVEAASAEAKDFLDQVKSQVSES